MWALYALCSIVARKSNHATVFCYTSSHVQHNTTPARVRALGQQLIGCTLLCLYDSCIGNRSHRVSYICTHGNTQVWPDERSTQQFLLGIAPHSWNVMAYTTYKQTQTYARTPNE